MKETMDVSYGICDYRYYSFERWQSIISAIQKRAILNSYFKRKKQWTSLMASAIIGSKQWALAEYHLYGSEEINA